MRIIAGQRRGKRLAAPVDRTIRPTGDRIRESIFNILGPRVTGAVVLDVFAGTGALGIEALSRGARSACFVDQDQRAVGLIRRNLDACRFAAPSRVVHRDALEGLPMPAAGEPLYDLVFMDPPYDRGMVAPALDRLARQRIVAPQALIIVEHARNEPLPAAGLPWVSTDRRRWGKTLVSFLAAVL